MSLNVANSDFCKVLLKEVEAKKHGINPYIFGEFYPRAIDAFQWRVERPVKPMTTHPIAEDSILF